MGKSTSTSGGFTTQDWKERMDILRYIKIYIYTFMTFGVGLISKARRVITVIAASVVGRLDNTLYNPPHKLLVDNYC